MFPNSSGAVSGVGGGIVYPLVYFSTLLPNLHVGYAIVAVLMLPIVALNAWVYRSAIARRAHRDGFFNCASGDSTTASGD